MAAAAIGTFRVSADDRDRSGDLMMKFEAEYSIISLCLFKIVNHKMRRRRRDGQIRGRNFTND